MKNSLYTTRHYIQKLGFSDLSLSQFYQVAKLRQEVFIVEQQSIYADLDGLDQDAMHFLCWSSAKADAQLIAYARYRIYLPDMEYKIERVVTTARARGQGLGKVIMQVILQDIQTQQACACISLSAQVEAQAFYQSLGFVAQGARYDDGGIEHISMHYRA